MKTHSDSPAGIGVITILMILTVLCLSAFSALTLFTARADLQLSQVHADSVTAYYNADRIAAQQAAAFAAGPDDVCSMVVPMDGRQELYLHLIRQPDGTVGVLSWQTRPIGEIEVAQPELPVWDGSFSQ